MKLHKTQNKILKYIENNEFYTIRLLQEEFDLSTPSLVQHHLKQLVKKGELEKTGNKYIIRIPKFQKLKNEINILDGEIISKEKLFEIMEEIERDKSNDVYPYMPTGNNNSKPA